LEGIAVVHSFVAPVWMPADRAESNERRSNKPCTEV